MHAALSALAAIIIGVSFPVLAQDQPSGAKTGCPNATASTGATPPDAGHPASGTSPGTAGSTGWTGGMGGSYIGTTPNGPSPASRSTDHPATAKGLDPLKQASKGNC